MRSSVMIQFPPTTTTTARIVTAERQRCLRFSSAWSSSSATAAVYENVLAEQQQHLNQQEQQPQPDAQPQPQQQQNDQHCLLLRKQWRPIYVSAVRQHVGKTSTCLALLSGLQKRFDNKVGFMKPVGQISLTVPDDEEPNNNCDSNNSNSSGVDSCGDSSNTNTNVLLHVDKDAALIKQHFQLDHVTYRQVNPVLIPKGYTRDYLNGQISPVQQRRRIVDAYQAIRDQSCNGVVLCEGTGHVAVGSIVDASNAKVASWIDARMILVANGGLGQTMDELDLNYAYLQQQQQQQQQQGGGEGGGGGTTQLAGVIINKVKPEKYEQTKHYIEKALQQKYGDSVPLLGW
jgi:dethiobiotin synthetase